MDWTGTADELPPQGLVVDTKIHGPGEVPHNLQPLMRRGNLWFLPDGSMCVYHTPSHWRRVAPPDGVIDERCDNY
jgi:hypothetical protein